MGRINIRAMKSPEKVFLAVVKEYQYSDQPDLNQYLIRETHELEGTEQSLSSFLAAVETVKVIDRQLCDCQKHYWLSVQTYEDAEGIIHADIEFERELMHWKIKDIVLPCPNEAGDDLMMVSIFGNDMSDTFAKEDGDPEAK